MKCFICSFLLNVVLSAQTKVYFSFPLQNHYGGLDGGHYTAYCKNVPKQRWFKFDDHEVSDISTSSVKSSAAYILFYSTLWSSWVKRRELHSTRAGPEAQGRRFFRLIFFFLFFKRRLEDLVPIAADWLGSGGACEVVSEQETVGLRLGSDKGVRR